MVPLETKATLHGSRVRKTLFALAHWRCTERVIIFESDDWGLLRRPAAEVLRNYGPPSRWADESSETPNDLEQLFAVLEQYRDPAARSALFVGNFVLSTPNFEAISSSGYTEYHDLPITQSASPQVVQKWRDGFARRIFYPQYHARAHFWPSNWLRDLQSDTPGARMFFDMRLHGGLALILRRGWRYHTEYMNWETGEERSDSDAQAWIETAISTFNALFGFRPRSTIAPHYIFTPRTARIWSNSGIKFVQGTNYRILRGRDAEQHAFSHVFGEHPAHGQIYVGRNVKFDPRPQHSEHGLESALKQIQHAFKRHIPAVIDTHRINYTGTSSQESTEALKRLMNAVSPYQPYFLTSDELGEAIANQGRFHDVWTNQERKLTPWRSPLRKLLRTVFSRDHARLADEYYGP